MNPKAGTVADNPNRRCSESDQSGTARPASDSKIIIGGGMAGLACGCYLQMNGFQTEILEAESGPGGLCTAWNRGPYVFDGCLRWLVGTNSASVFHQIWRELGAFSGREVWNHDSFMQIEGLEGEVLSVAADLDQLALEFKRVAPADAARIDKLMAAARRCACLEPPLGNPLELMTPFEKIKAGLGLLPTVPVIMRWKGRTMGAYLATYQSRFLRQVLLTLAGDARVSALALAVLLGWRSRKIIGYAAGGSRALVGTIAERYARLGGRVRYNTRVMSVTVEAGRATGVRCSDGTFVPASTVVSCADGQTTIFKMLEGRFVSRKLMAAYQTGDICPGHLQVSLGLHQSFPSAPHMLSLPLSPPLTVDDETLHERLSISIFSDDTALCPKDHTVMTIGLSCHSEYWIRLRSDHPVRYQEEKQKLLNQIIPILDRRFPGLGESLEYSDVATPASFVRHTGNWMGSGQGWLPTPRIVGWQPPRTLPGLKEFYMAGHWIEPGGGLPFAALSARYAAQMICASHGRTFAATEN